MRVSLFGLFLRCTILMGPWFKRIKSILHIISFTSDFLFYDCYDIPIHIYTSLCSNPPAFCTWHSYSPLARHLALYHTRLGSFTDSPGFSCPGIGAYGFLSCWSEWRSGSVDLQPTFRSSILPGPSVSLPSFPFKLVSIFILFYSCTSTSIPAFAHICDVILL